MKYKLTFNTKTSGGITLYQIEALVDIPQLNIKKGDLGGWIQKESNLNQIGDAWVYGNALVSDNARVSDNALVSGNAKVSGNAWVYDNALVSDNAKVSGNAWVYGDALVGGNAKVYGDAKVSGDAKIENTNDYMTISSLGDLNRTITITFSNKMIHAGCFIGTLDEFKEAVDKKYQGRGNYYATINYITELFGNNKYGELNKKN